MRSSKQFAFDNVTFISVVVLKVGRFLSTGDIDAKNPVIEHDFDQGSETVVIAEVLKSDELSVVGVNDAGNGMSIHFHR